ncbi:HAD-IIB family hydrolase [bacterium]|nr:HAD-IIB family hydrolase [bacterium]
MKAPNIRAVFTDLDGTLTTDRFLLDSTYESLWRLKRARLFTAVVTGRPAGWAEMMIRLWPLDAVVYENGAGLYVRGENGVRMIPLAARDNSPAQREKLQQLFLKIREAIPEAQLSMDQPYRLFDFALVHCEEGVHLTAAQREIAGEILRSEPGVHASVSNTHINYLFGHHDKRTGARALLATPEALGIAPDEVAFIGDSLNDEPLFEYFLHTFGVANVRDVWDSLSSRPRTITQSRGGKGFEEFVSEILTP